MNHIKLLEELVYTRRDYPGFPSGSDSPTGWVNVKIDNDLPLRISRYATSLDRFTNKEGIEEKLNILSSTSPRDYGVQCGLSIIMLLQYLKEIIGNFGSSSAGTIFESYIGGLLHLPFSAEHYKSEDLTHDGYTYQIKLYKNKGLIKFKSECDYYIYAIKDPGEIKIWILNEEEVIDNILTEAGNVSIRDLRNLPHQFAKWVLKYQNIDDHISEISKGLKKDIDIMYKEISELNYNIESITTGVDKDKEIVGYGSIDDRYKSAEGNIVKIQDHLKKIKKNIKHQISIKGYQGFG